MSFLLPTLRNAFRSNIRTTTNILRQQYYVSRQIHPHQLIPSATRFYSKGNPGPNNSNSASKKESIEDAAVPDSTAPKDHLSGDVQATPGSILSEYTASPQGSAQLEPSASDSGSGQLPKKEEYVSSTDRKRQRIAKTLSWGSLLGLLGGSIWLGRPLDKEEEERMGWENLPRGHTPSAYWKRFQKRGKSMLAYFNEPAFEKLLPPPAPEPYSRPYTLLLDLDDLLIHSEWTREHGWRTAKRPGLDYFLGYLSQYYEIVIFTTQYSGLAIPVVSKLDPYHTSVSNALFREHTRYIDGKVVKDLSYLNRDLEKVILVDTNPDSCRLQPDNAIIVDKWKGDVHDKGLVALIPYLEYLASQNFNDFRPILREYKESAAKRNTTIPDEFARREALAREALQKTLKPAPTESSGPSFISRLFGLRSLPPVQVATPAQGEIVTPLDLMRQQATEGYEAMKKYIDEHGAEILEEDKKREQQILGEQKMSLVGHMSRFGSPGVVPPPADGQDDKKGK